MSLGFDDALKAVTDHPWIAAGAVVVGLVLLRPSGGGGGGAADMTASLTSMQIASDTNVQLAGIQAQRDSVAIQAKRDVVLGAIDYAKTDRTSNLAANIAAMDNNKAVTDTAFSAALAGFQSALGFSAAKKDLENQRAALDVNSSIGFADINANKTVALESIFSSRDLGISEINANLDFSKYSLPFNERMHLEEQATIRNLAWRQKQIAKIGANADLFGGLISGGFGTLNNAMAIFGGTK